jgi:hypothetical protein
MLGLIVLERQKRAPAEASALLKEMTALHLLFRALISGSVPCAASLLAICGVLRCRHVPGKCGHRKAKCESQSECGKKRSHADYSFARLVGGKKKRFAKVVVPALVARHPRNAVKAKPIFRLARLLRHAVWLGSASSPVRNHPTPGRHWGVQAIHSNSRALATEA